MSIFRREQAKPASFDKLRPMVAAAQKVTYESKEEFEQVKKRQAQDKWQDYAWEYFDLIGEVKYAFNLIGAVMSRLRLYAGYVTDLNDAPSHLAEVEDIDPALVAAANRALARLATAPGGLPGLLRDATVNMLVAGEFNLVQIPPKIGSGTGESWTIKSVNELVLTSSGKFGIRVARNAQQRDIRELPQSAFIARVWKMHPRYSAESDSSMRPLLDLCDELLLLNRLARSTARSRLNAGALFVPDALSVSTSELEDLPESDDDQDTTLPSDISVDADEDSFEEELMSAMTTPIKDEDSVSAVVPLLIRGPADLGDKIKHIKFERSFDPQLIQRAERVLERILQGLDIPKDIVTGLANIKYSNAVQIEDSLYKSHIEPLALLLCDAFTVVYMRQALKAEGFEDSDVAKVVIWYDPSAITTHTDRSTAANQGFEHYALSWDAWRRANGFSDTDAPNELEIAQRMAIERGQLLPEVSEALLRTLVPGVLDQVRAESLAESPSPLSEGAQEILGTDEGGPIAIEDAPAPEAPAAPAPDSPPAPSGLAEPT